MLMALVPAYEEEERIAGVVIELLSHVDDVVVIDDGSKDSTAKKAEEAGATVLRHRLNRGQGAALETGHAYARLKQADYVLHFDGDGQFSVEDIAPAVQALQEANADILFGSRFLDKQSELPWQKRYVLLPIARLIDQLFGALPLSDAHNGFRLLTRKALDEIMITQDRMAHASEIPQLVRKKGLRYVEFPVHVTYHRFGQGAIGGVHIIKDLLMQYFVR